MNPIQSDLELFNLICSNSLLAKSREAQGAIVRITGAISKGIAESYDHFRDRPLVIIKIDEGYQVGHEGAAKTIIAVDRKDFSLLFDMVSNPLVPISVSSHGYRTGASARTSLTRIKRKSAMLHLIHRKSPALSNHLHRCMEFSDTYHTATYRPDPDEPLVVGFG